MNFVITYMVAGFVFTSIFTIFKKFISERIFNENYSKVKPHEFGMILLIWPLLFIGIVFVGGYKLIEGSIITYIDWLSNILGDKK